MLSRVDIERDHCTPSVDLETYRPLVVDALVDEIKALAADLADVRICHINSTANGGGVAELLGCQLPLMQTLNTSVDWRIIDGDAEFFQTTKGVHNALQGDIYTLCDTSRRGYLEHNQVNAQQLEREHDYDVYIVHDPQPAALCQLTHNRRRKWIWRCHIDTSTPNPDVWSFMCPFIEAYDAAVFTLEAFVPPDLRTDHLALIPPAIDPFSCKNKALPAETCNQMLDAFGLDLHRPILLQVSRFDPWKDPHGVIQAYRLVKQAQPDVQLVLIGALADDDPEGWSILQTIQQEAEGDEDLHVFTNLTGMGSLEVNAFQRRADVVIQKSIKEGFGLVVSEALWKGKPMVAGQAGGIPLQFPAQFQRYLVGSVEECAKAILDLLEHPCTREEFGQAGREHVRQKFLLPRLIRDELALVHDLLS